ncbi:MAG: response regulator transcription factor [Candidatus Hodarchaeales archaeon]
MDIIYKIEIKPSYQWDECALELGVSHRELEVLSVVAEGFSNKEAAQILHIKHQSVKNHMHSLLKKINAKNSLQALILAVNYNMIDAKAKPANMALEPVDVDIELIKEAFKGVITGETTVKNIDNKKIKRIRVWLREHGVDVGEWE